MRKNLALALCLSLIFILVGCNSNKKVPSTMQTTNENQTLEDRSKDTNTQMEATNEKNSVDEKKEISANTNSIPSTETSSNAQVAKDKNNASQKITKVNRKVKLYEGTYWDERCLDDNILNLKSYCEVVISNVTNTSFDFTVYEVDRQTENRKVIFLTNTAVFIADGKSAAFYGKDYTLNFTFPSITEVKISGFKPLEDKTYLNNKIPGHECS